MTSELRGEFRRELDALDISVGALLGLLPDAIRTATDALILPGGDLADKVWAWRALVDDLYDGVVTTVESIVARQAPVARDLRFLLGCLRLVPTLYDSVDLVADISAPSTVGLDAVISARTSHLLRAVGEHTALTWSAVEMFWSARDAPALSAVRQHDDALAEVRSALSAEFGSGGVDLSAAMQLALVGRSFERLGRHAATAAHVIVGLGPKRSDES